MHRATDRFNRSWSKFPLAAVGILFAGLLALGLVVVFAATCVESESHRSRSLIERALGMTVPGLPTSGVKAVYELASAEFLSVTLVAKWRTKQSEFNRILHRLGLGPEDEDFARAYSSGWHPLETEIAWWDPAPETPPGSVGRDLASGRVFLKRENGQVYLMLFTRRTRESWPFGSRLSESTRALCPCRNHDEGIGIWATRSHVY